VAAIRQLEARVLEGVRQSSVASVRRLRLEIEAPPVDDPDPAYERIRIGLDLFVSGADQLIAHALLAASTTRAESRSSWA